MTSAGTALAKPRIRPWWVALSWGAIAGQIVFTLGWVSGDTVQNRHFSPFKDDISDLGALTASHPWIILSAQAISSTLTIAFALLALGPLLARPGRFWSLSAVLMASSSVALDDLSDAFFRLDCQASTIGCTGAAAVASWHGQIHAIVGTITFIVTVVTPFFLARSMRGLPEWSHLARRADAYGIGLAVLVGAYVLLPSQLGQGVAQRAVSLAASAGVCLLAAHVARISGRSPNRRTPVSGAA